ncbi:MAG: polysaccharide deacetylase family protein [Maricaulaceae bacterium]|nr:polysaccharide deacetylase family protein [Maricaulaceae bacterium]
MTPAPYIPSAGPLGRLARLQARFTARDPLRIALDRPLVSVTFDDFPKSAAIAGRAALEKHGWSGTWFASAGFAGTVTHHGPMFEAADIASLAAAGHEIGCHTFGHGDAARMSEAELLKDAGRNADALMAMGASGFFRSFAFPYGEASPAAKRALGARFGALRGVRPGINRDGADRLLLCAVGIDGGAAGVARALDFIELAAERPGWLIFYVHDVQDEPTPWGCTPQELADVLAAVAESGAGVLPMAAALDAVNRRNSEAA